MKQFFPAIFLLQLQFYSVGQGHTYVNVISKINFSAKADSILKEALPLIDSVINSAGFRDGILNAKFVSTYKLSNAEILKLFLTGAEVYTAAPNDTMDLKLETYPDQVGDNVGTTHNSERIVSSEAYILRNGSRCYAAHIIHEYCHTIGKGKEGFMHRHRVRSKKQEKEKCRSVPYIIGDLARKILGVQTCNCECQDFPQE